MDASHGCSYRYYTHSGRTTHHNSLSQATTLLVPIEHAYHLPETFATILHVHQELYKETDYRSVGQSVVRTAMALTESVAFVLAQLTLEGQRAVESKVQLKDELTKQRHENGRLTMQVATYFINRLPLPVFRS